MLLVGGAWRRIDELGGLGDSKRYGQVEYVVNEYGQAWFAANRRKTELMSVGFGVLEFTLLSLIA